MGTVLIYEITQEKENRLKELAIEQNVKIKRVSPSSYGESLGFLAGISGFSGSLRGKNEGILGEEMMVFSGMDGDRVDLFLDEMKKRQITVALKAILTPYNIRWDSRKLSAELKKEREAFR